MDSKDLLSCGQNDKLRSLCKAFNIFATGYSFLAIGCLVLYVVFLSQDASTEIVNVLIYLQLAFGVVHGINGLLKQKLFTKDIAMIHIFNALEGEEKDPIVSEQIKNSKYFDYSLMSLISSSVFLIVFHAQANILNASFETLKFEQIIFLTGGITSFIFSIILFVYYSKKIQN